MWGQNQFGRRALHSLSFATLEQIVQASLQGILLLEVQGHRARIRYANPAYERMSGYAERELVGNAWSTHFAGDCAFSDAEELNRVIMRGLPAACPVACLRKDGAVWESSVHLSRIGGARGDTTLILVQHVLGETAAVVEPVEPGRAGRRRQPAAAAPAQLMSGMLAADQFAALLSRDLAIARRHERKVTLILFEIIEFETYRETFGSLAAEACARMVGTQILCTFGRSIDLRARLDAVSFAVAVHEQPEASAEQLAGTVADKVSRLSLPNPRGRTSRHVQVASTCVEAAPERDDAKKLIERSRRALAGELQERSLRPAMRSAG